MKNETIQNRMKWEMRRHEKRGSQPKEEQEKIKNQMKILPKGKQENKNQIRVDK